MEQITPVFMCKSPEETRDFYEALGFEVTYWQDQPYVYGAVKRGDINLNFTKGKRQAMCLVHVPSIADYHQDFADGLREKYGRVPTADFPRLARLRTGHTRFYVFDPTGNELLFINQDEPDIDYDAYDAELSPLMKVLNNATFVRDTYANDQAAAKLLDKKLKQHQTAPAIDRARVLAARAELAVALGEMETVQRVREELEALRLTDEDRDLYQEELQAADRLEQWQVRKID